MSKNIDLKPISSNRKECNETKKQKKSLLTDQDVDFAKVPENIDVKSVSSIRQKFEETEKQKKLNKSNSKSSSRASIILKNISISRFSAVPISIFYGLFIYYYVTFIILSSTNAENNKIIPPEVNVSSSVNTCAIRFVKMQFNLSQNNQRSTINMSSETNNLNNYVGAGIGIGLSLSLGVASVFSHYARCSYFLVIPGLLAGRGRALMLTVAMGVLLDGPVNSINYNVEQVVNSISCMYNEMSRLACEYQIQFHTIFQDVARLIEQIQEIMENQRKILAETANKMINEAKDDYEIAKKKLEEQIKSLSDKLSSLRAVINTPGNIANSLCNTGESVIATVRGGLEDAGNEIASWFGRRRRSACGIPAIVPGVDIDTPGLQLDNLLNWAKKLNVRVDVMKFNLNEFKGILQSQSISELRKKMINILKDVFFIIKKYSELIKKVFYITSLVLVIYDAYRYLRKYYTDLSFDNMFVDNNLATIWKNDDGEKLTPLRHWELEERYQVSKSLKITKREAQRIILHATPTIIFTAIAFVTVMSDFALASLLSMLLQHGEFGISFAGMEQSLNLGDLFEEVKVGKRTLFSLNLKGFDLTTEPCLPRPMKTSYSNLSVLIAIIIVSFISCIFDIYASRWRSQICNLFYVEKAKQRAVYLYKRIRSGRGTRKLQLKMIISREVSRRESLKEFSLFEKIAVALKRNSKNKMCPGCNWKIVDGKEQQIQIKVSKVSQNVIICSDCAQDYIPNVSLTN